MPPSSYSVSILYAILIDASNKTEIGENSVGNKQI